MLSFEYPIAVKHEIISSIRPYFDDSYPDPQYANKIHIGLDWPQTVESLPMIMVTFTEGAVQNVGLGHYEKPNDDEMILRHYMFDGHLNFNVLALTPLDRDKVAAGLMNLLAFSDTIPAFEGFLDEFSDDDYVTLVMNSEQITPRGENTAPVPWGNENEMIFGNTYSVPIHGEFYSDTTTGALIRISEVDVWPYRPGDIPHWTD